MILRQALLLALLAAVLVLAAGLAFDLPALVWIALGAALVPLAVYLLAALALLGLALAFRIARLRCPGCSD